MKTEFKDTPRVFSVKGHEVRDWGKVRLEAGEMVSFVTPSGKECDFAAKDWGFYLGPSVNDRLKREGFKTALVLNEGGQLYVLAVEKEKMDLFAAYMSANQSLAVVTWLDEWLGGGR
ncbi:MAG: hypothetical protein WC943_03555 [Elusimicrobiota bacterium]|jgi:hypothetical protein